MAPGESNLLPRLIALVLLGLLAAIQYPLWIGKGSRQNIVDLQLQLADQRKVNDGIREELKTLEAEAESLRSGQDAIEMRARSRLNMIRSDEVLFRLEQ
jgi:cell division protein FtsB